LPQSTIPAIEYWINGTASWSYETRILCGIEAVTWAELTAPAGINTSELRGHRNVNATLMG